ncbi:hypothetical protein [Formosa haliotis]|uniref:hypothetical protein n=1 Tax=Formosa haliotis TaxID=1555194 RepID=UPI00082632C6|nr:hypothetical protein [Formosa haliotis]
MNILFIVPNLQKVSGGPKTRITMFKKVFLKHNDIVIEKGNKLFRSIKPRKINVVYVESATNRLSFVDIICLFFLRLYSKEVIVFIRDIYIELFPESYASLRSKITLVFNKCSNFYLTLISTSMVFPTLEMGRVFFDKNKFFPRREYTNLPPGTLISDAGAIKPDFSKKLGLLYLGGTRYENSGFNLFMAFYNRYSSYYNFFVLSGDSNLKADLENTNIHINCIKHDEIPGFLAQHNVAFAMHTRPRNEYDDLTFPIKVLDFISLQLPFFTENHLPLQTLLGKDYYLFNKLETLENVHQVIQCIDESKYLELQSFFKKLTFENTYDVRYKKLLSK